MFRLPLLTIVQVIAIGTACAQAPRSEVNPINRPIDLMSPRLISDGVTFYLGKVVYRNGQIVSADVEGKTVSINTTSGVLNLEWAKLNPDTQRKFQVQYDLAVARAVAELERAKDLAEGIISVSGKIISIPNEGLLIEGDDGIVVLVIGHPRQDGFADGDSVSCRAKLFGIFKYGSIWAGRKTVRSYKYIRD